MFTYYVHMQGLVKRWGGSYAIRVSPEEARRHGLKDGMEVDVNVIPRPIDWATLPTFQDVPDAAARHDELLHGGDSHSRSAGRASQASSRSSSQSHAKAGQPRKVNRE